MVQLAVFSSLARAGWGFHPTRGPDVPPYHVIKDESREVDDPALAQDNPALTLDNPAPVPGEQAQKIEQAASTGRFSCSATETLHLIMTSRRRQVGNAVSQGTYIYIYIYINPLLKEE